VACLQILNRQLSPNCAVRRRDRECPDYVDTGHRPNVSNAQEAVVVEGRDEWVKSTSKRSRIRPGIASATAMQQHDSWCCIQYAV